MYLFLTGKKDKILKIREYLLNDGKENRDLLCFYQNNAFSCLYIAADAVNDQTDKQHIFRGYYIDHDNRRLIFSGNMPARFLPAEKSYSGSYILIERDKNRITVSNDYFSIRPMFYFSTPDLCVISGSIFLIAEIRKACGIKNPLNEKTGICSSWINGKSAQLMSFNTLVHDIFFAPLNSRLRISLDGPDLSLKCHFPTAAELFRNNTFKSQSAYREVLKRSSERLAGLCGALLAQNEFQTRLALSGGLDSRCCLASLKKLFKNHKTLISTSSKAAEDYRIVRLLADKMNLQLNQPFNTLPQPGTPLSRWIILNGAKYHILLDHHSACANKADRIISVSGVGAECVKGDFGWKTLAELFPAMKDNSTVYKTLDRRYLAQKPLLKRLLHVLGLFPSSILRERAIIILKELKGVLEKLDIDPKSRDTSEFLYTYFRNPCHAGCSCHYSFQIFPLMEPDLVSLAHSNGRYWFYPQEGMPSIISDLLISIDPELAALPFSGNRPCLSASYIKERQKFLTSPVFGDFYEIVGSLAGTSSGISEIFIKLAERRGFKGNLEFKNWKELAENAFESLPPTLRKHFDIYGWFLRNDFPQNIYEHKWRWHIGGKLLSFLLADG